MKNYLFMLALVFSLGAGVNAFALTALPNGHWTGSGHAGMQDGTTAQYTEDLTVNNNVSTIALTMGNEAATYVLTHTFTGNGFVKLSIEEKAEGVTLQGSGYCGSVWCHVEADDHSFEMTYVFDGKNVYELGSSVESGAKGWFESQLTAAK